MSAAVNRRYGPPEVVEVRRVAKPEPQPGEVLVKVHTTTVNRSDCGFLRAHPFAMRAFTGLLRPRRDILGMDFAGVVEARGEGSKIFAIGQRGFGVCSWGRLGAHAEYVCVPEQRNIAAIPANVSFESAVVGEGALYANASLKSLELERGQRILIYGASGAIGVAALQLARAHGSSPSSKPAVHRRAGQLLRAPTGRACRVLGRARHPAMSQTR
jgi:NADPH:quinone reductase-like Zn-dependent oxidoreductase